MSGILQPLIAGAEDFPTGYNPGTILGGMRVSNKGTSTFNRVANGPNGVKARAAKSSGKWYWEFSGYTRPFMIGFVKSTGASTYTDADAWCLYLPVIGNYAIYHGSSPVTSTGLAGDGDVFGFALDIGGNTFDVYKNNTLLMSASSLALTGSQLPLASGPTDDPGIGGTTNFGHTTLTYTPPTGYSAWLQS